MTAALFALVLFLVSIVAGFLGALLGIGGGIILTPFLTLVLGIDIRYAIGASIVAVIATSSGATASYVRDKITNLRVEMLLEMATVAGAIGGASISRWINAQMLYLIFAAIVAYSALMMLWRPSHEVNIKPYPDRLADTLKLHSAFVDAQTRQSHEYRVHRTWLGFVLMVVAGMLSGLLGVGGGAFKVPAMDLAMGIPLKVSSATSNFMIGVTAAASAAVYFHRGDIDPAIAGPEALGVVAGAMIGARVMPHIKTAVLRRLFVSVFLVVAVQMARKGLML